MIFDSQAVIRVFLFSVLLGFFVVLVRFLALFLHAQEHMQNGDVAQLTSDMNSGVSSRQTPNGMV